MGLYFFILGDNIAVYSNVPCHTVKRTFRSTPEGAEVKHLTLELKKKHCGILAFPLRDCTIYASLQGYVRSLP